MALVLMATMPWGTLWDREGNAQTGESVVLKERGGPTLITHYLDDAGADPSTVPILSDDRGRLMRYVEEGSYDLLDRGETLPVEATAGSSATKVLPADVSPAAPANRQRPQYRSSGAAFVMQDPDVVDLRDWDGVRPWRTSTGYVMTSGSPLMTCTADPFTSADVGKIVIAKQSGVSTDPLYMSTVLSVNGSGVATMADNAPASVPGGQRGQRGFDCTTALNAALVEVAADNFDTRRVHLPGLYRASQIVLPMGVDFDGSFWGTLIPTPGGIGDLAKRTKAGTWLQQLPGSQKDFLILEKYLDGGAGRNWGGLYGISNLMLIGPEQSVIGKTWTLGSGFAAVASDGDPLAMLDGLWIGHRGPIYATGFPQDGFYFPDGGVPLFLERLRPYFNGRYGVNVEVRSIAGSQGGNSPNTHLTNVSGDGNSSGLARFSGFSNWATIVITNLKSEKADYFPTAGSPGSPGSPTSGALQENALIFDECNDTPVVINGVTHISAAPNNAHTDAPGPLIRITSATDKRPRISARGCGERVTGDETTNTSNMVTLRDSVISVDIPAGVPHFDWPPRNDQPGFDQLAGEETFPRALAIGSNVTLSSGNLRGCVYTCKKTQTVATVHVGVGATGAGATPTLVRVGIYTVAANGDLALVASSANNTGKLAAANADETFTLSTPYKTLAGRRYAIAILVVTAAAAPTIGGTSTLNGTYMAKAPRLSFGLGGQTDLPASVTEVALAGAANTGVRPFFELVA